MPRRAVGLELAEQDKEVLTGWAREPGKRGMRARIVLACAEPGAVNEQVAASVDTTVVTVGKWRRRYAAEGLAGLDDAPRSGRPRAALELTSEERSS